MTATLTQRDLTALRKLAANLPALLDRANVVAEAEHNAASATPKNPDSPKARRTRRARNTGTLRSSNPSVWAGETQHGDVTPAGKVFSPGIDFRADDDARKAANRAQREHMRSMGVVPKGQAWQAVRNGERDATVLKALNAADGLVYAPPRPAKPGFRASLEAHGDKIAALVAAGFTQDEAQRALAAVAG